MIAEEGKAGRNPSERWAAILVSSPAASNSDILNTHREPGFTPGRTALPAIKGSIALEHVTFRYIPDGPVVLHDISITIPAGQVVGIVRSVRFRQIDACEVDTASLCRGKRTCAC